MNPGFQICVSMNEVYESMELRRLDKSERGKTRELWERVFEEDSKAFLDYYYFFKTRDNEIFVLEEDGAIRSMLHLNPYTIQVEEEQFTGNYIIAVATEEAYRKRGYMGQLLRQSMQEMYKRKELFTFLMPAAAAIYTPYDFSFVYDQNVWMYTNGEPHGKTTDKEVTVENNLIKERQHMEVRGAANEYEVVTSEAGIGEGRLLADFFNAHFAEQFQVYAVRDENYYQTMLFEQQSENGGIRLLKKGREVIGSFLYGDEEGLEIREPLYLKEYETEFWNAVNSLCTERGQKQALLYAGINYSNTEAGVQEDSEGFAVNETGRIHVKQLKPTIMVRIIHLESLFGVLKVKDGEEIDCSFAVLDAILPQNSRVWRIQSKSVISQGDKKEISNENGEEINSESDLGREEVTASKEVEVRGDLFVRETEDSEGVLTIAALTDLLFGYKTVEEVSVEPDVYLTEHLKKELEKIQPLKKIYLNEIV